MPRGSKFNRSELDEIFINDINICKKKTKKMKYLENILDIKVHLFLLFLPSFLVHLLILIVIKINK